MYPLRGTSLNSVRSPREGTCYNKFIIECPHRGYMVSNMHFKLMYPLRGRSLNSVRSARGGTCVPPVGALSWPILSPPLESSSSLFLKFVLAIRRNIKYHVSTTQAIFERACMSSKIILNSCASLDVARTRLWILGFSSEILGFSSLIPGFSN